MDEYFRQKSEKHLISELKKKEDYEEATKPVFTTEAGFVTITMDDGPTIYTDPILNYLEKKQVRAIFFMLGSQIKKYPKIAQEVADAGHVIGNHSYSHPFLSKLTENEQEEEIKRTNELIGDITGVGPRFFRPPYGSFNETTLRLVRKYNMKEVMWSADPKDYTYNNPNNVFRATEPLLSSRKILLLHDLKKATADAIPTIIDSIREKNLSITEEFEK